MRVSRGLNNARVAAVAGVWQPLVEGHGLRLDAGSLARVRFHPGDAGGQGRHCEKPLTHNIREGRAMTTAARRYWRIVQSGSQYGWAKRSPAS